jgi:hypothetical protein
MRIPQLFGLEIGRGPSEKWSCPGINDGLRDKNRDGWSGLSFSQYIRRRALVPLWELAAELFLHLDSF